MSKGYDSTTVKRQASDLTGVKQRLNTVSSMYNMIVDDPRFNPTQVQNSVPPLMLKSAEEGLQEYIMGSLKDIKKLKPVNVQPTQFSQAPLATRSEEQRVVDLSQQMMKDQWE